MRGLSLLALSVMALAVVSGPGLVEAQDAFATRTLRAGTVLTPADLRPAEKDGAEMQARIATLVGLETRRAIYAGRPVLEADLGPPILVRRNAVVTMIYRDGALAIRAEGRALDPGGSDETVRVINLTSRQTVTARVLGQNQVEVRR